MIYFVEEKSDWDDDSMCYDGLGLWELVRLFEFESDAEAWIRRESKMRDIPIKSFRIFNSVTKEIKYFE